MQEAFWFFFFTLMFDLNDLLNMDRTGSEALRLLVKKRNNLGLDYFPVAHT